MQDGTTYTPPTLADLRTAMTTHPLELKRAGRLEWAIALVEERVAYIEPHGLVGHNYRLRLELLRRAAS